MSDTTPGRHAHDPATAATAAAASSGHLPTHAAAVDVPVVVHQAGPVGKVRGTGMCILLTVVTLGIYPIVWYFMVHDEMKRHTNDGIGGGVALLLALLVSFVMPFLSSNEVGNLYARRGLGRPVSGATGLWYLPGFLILVGPLVWFVKTNGALNDYWRSLGAR